MSNQISNRIKITLSIFFTCLLMQSCLEETVDVKSAKSKGLLLQLHNFNSQRVDDNNILILDGTAPDIFYFKQNGDGTYNFTLSSGYPNAEIYTGFDWFRKYKAGTLNNDGVISKLVDVFYPTDAAYSEPFSFWALGQVSSYYNSIFSQRFVATNNELTYFNFDRIITINPWQNLQSSFKWPGSFSIGTVQRTNDGGYITSEIQYPGTTSYYKFSRNGSLVFNHSQSSVYANIFEPESLSVFAAEKGGDNYFIEINPDPGNGPSTFKMILEGVEISKDPSTGLLELIGFFGGNAANSTLSVNPGTNFDVEVRFGPGKSQKAHRFLIPIGATNANISSFSYQDYVDVPFEVWDITNNRQLMVSFRDQGRDGQFNLVNYNVSGPAEQQSREFLYIHNLPYSPSPNSSITVNGGQEINRAYVFWPVLNDGMIWDAANLPSTTLLIDHTPPAIWLNRLVKVNQSGVTVVKENFLNGNSRLKNIFKILPYKDGFAMLCNAPQPYTEYAPPQLIILDENFNQKDVASPSIDADNMHRMESNGDAIFYSSGAALLISVYRDGKIIKKDLSDLIGFSSMKLESYNITPTLTGGVAILAWVKPTSNTRDLLFLELDENLELVKK